MSRVTPSRARFEILSDSSSSDDDHWCYENLTARANHSAILRDLSIPHSQNRRSSAGSASDSTVDSVTTDLRQLHIDTKTHQLSRVQDDFDWVGKQKKQPGSRLTRPSLAANTFEVLETVPEDESRGQSESAAPSVSDNSQHFLELPVEQYSRHPLSIAAQSIPSVEEQLAKHRNGDFEWVLSVRVPVPFTSPLPKQSAISESEATPVIKTQFFGCNLLPTQEQFEGDSHTKDCAPSTYTLLVTPLKSDEDILEEDGGPVGEANMAVAEINSNPTTPIKRLSALSTDGPQRLTPMSSTPTRGDDSFLDVITTRSPMARPVSRIEDTLEALDELEDQLEAFDKAAHFRQMVPSHQPKSANKHPVLPDSAKSTGSVRFATPQVQKNVPKMGSSVRAKPATEPRQPSLRKATSMIFLDSPKLKLEDKPLAQAPLKKRIANGLASLLPPKPPVKSTKQPTIPVFQLPGDAVARKIKEKREARISTQAAVEQATKPTASSLRKTKSVKLPTRPNFELPGEAISRRKREEHEAQLRAQEEAERKRREFKARPIRSSAVPSTVPRETIASRARQNKVVSTENSAQKAAPSLNKRASTIHLPSSRPPLSHLNGQSQPRGRGLHPESSPSDSSRAASSSTRSVSGKRSQVSTEEVQQQRLRGHEIYQRDNSLAEEREREKREREALAKLARAEAAERSRQQSREWAAKQARKRMTVGSLRDVAV
ncbi:hypothetical protein F5X99DRAFT_397059 [Biscogniauxia marginata]|nr:hypothetical protein F5X99DRAFT_397059 [Biscogniauxia marginata]